MKSIINKNSTRTFALYGSIAVLIIAYSLLINDYVQMQINDNARINTAGRLRMLTQKITKEILLFQDGKVPKQPVENSVSILHSSIHAITFGGTVPLDMRKAAFRELPAMDDKKSHDMLVGIISEWEPFKYHVQLYLVDKNEASLKYILALNESLMMHIDEAVLSIQMHAESDQQTLGLIISSAISLVIISALAALARQVRRYRRASVRLEEIERLLPICSNCKKIRTDNSLPDDPRSWTSIEEYLRDKKEMLFTHSLCPDCVVKLYPDLFPERTKK